MMHNHPRAALAVAAASGLALTLAACSSGGNDTDGSTGAAGGTPPASANLTMSIWGSDADTQTYQQRVDAYTATHPGIKVTIRNIPTANYDQQLNTMLTGGDAPDIIEVDGNKAPDLASRGAILDLTPLISSDKVDLTTVDAGRLTGYQFDGDQYALPDRGGNIVFYYNKAMFDAAGLAYPKAGWTWDEMVSDAQKLTKSSGGETSQWGVAVDDWPNATTSVLTSFGCQWFDSDMKKSTIDSKECQTGLEKYGDLQLTLKVSPTLQDYADYGENVNRDALFAQGKAAMIWAGVWDAPDLVKNNISFGLVPPPTGVAGQPTMQGFGTGMAVAKSSKNQAAAWDVLKYLFTTEGQRPIVTNKQDVPSAKALIPDWEATLPAGVSYDEVSKAADQVFSQAAPPQINEITQQVQKDLDPYFNGQSSAADALKKAKSDIDSILESS